MAQKKANAASPDVYRIGDYARYMGVTPDFLKHYEQFNLIHSYQEENGYRFYPFSESFKIFECMKLRNHDFTVREMDVLLNSLDEPQVLEELEKKSAEIERELAFRKALTEEYHRFAEELRRMRGRKEDWWIQVNEPMLFLPHTRERSFIDDARIYELLESWVKWMPIVRSAARILPERREDGDWRKGCIWGLAVPQRIAKEHAFPVNSIVEEIPSRKTLYFHYSDAPLTIGDPDAPYSRLWETLDALHLSPAGPLWNIAFMSTHVNTNARHNGRYLVPLE